LHEIGEKASQIMYIYPNILFYLTALYDQADIFTSYLNTLQNTTTSVYKLISFNKAASDNDDYRLRRLARIMQKLENIDHNLSHVKRQTREQRRNFARRGEIKHASMITVRTQTIVI
jgi:hypothetical protein